MPKKKVTTKPKQTKSPKESRGAKMRDIERKILQSSEEEVKEIFDDESAMHSDESMFESDDDENDSQPRIDEDLESPSSEEENDKDIDEDKDERKREKLSEVFLTLVAVSLHRYRFYWNQERLSIKTWLTFDQKKSSAMHGSRFSR